MYFLVDIKIKIFGLGVQGIGIPIWRGGEKVNTIAPSPKEKKRKTVGGRASEASTPKQKDSELSTSKQKGSEVATSIVKESEIPTSTKKEPESKQKDISEHDKEIENMVIDDMIDLTFD